MILHFKNYIFKLFSNIISSISGSIILIFSPKILGPIVYGDFSFITNWFQNLISFFDLWITPGFYVEYSKSRKKELVSAVLLFLIFVSIFLFIFLSLGFLVPAIANLIWPGQKFRLLVLGLILAFTIWVNQIITNIYDANSKTHTIEFLRIISKVILLFSLCVIYFYFKFNLYGIFICMIASNLFLIIVSGVLFYERVVLIIRTVFSLNFLHFLPFFKRFYDFGKPLFFSSTLSILFLLADRWFLQISGGSNQQGVYSIAQNLGVMVLIFTSSYNPILLRLLINYRQNKDLNSIANIFKTEVVFIYFLTSILACFLFIEAKNILSYLGFFSVNAVLTFKILSIYTIHQSFGQVIASYYMASGRTSFYSKFSIIFSLVGFFLSIVLIFPRTFGGFELGAFGLSVKVFVIQLFSIYTLFYFLSRDLKISFLIYILRQTAQILILLFICHFLSLFFDKIEISSPKKLVYFFFVYLSIITMMSLFFPRVMVLTDAQSKTLKNKLFQIFRSLVSIQSRFQK